MEAACRFCGLSAESSEDVTLAVNEAASNAIRHAHLGQPDMPLQIECRHTGGGMEVSIFDRGAPFDVTAVPPLDPSEVRPGGRGVFLMRAVLDELTCYEREGGGNVLRMVKRTSFSKRIEA